jgi:hypothetical protein
MTTSTLQRAASYGGQSLGRSPWHTIKQSDTKAEKGQSE